MAVTIRKSGIRELTRTDVVAWVDKVAKRVEARASRHAPRFTGKLATSTKARKARARGLQVRARIGTNTGYGLFPEQGTGIYGPTGRVIRPRTKPFLVFQPRGLGHVIRVRSVKGQRPQHYMENALVVVIARST